MELPKRFGPYAITGPLGKGGMGQVYFATDERTGEKVALKSLSPHLAEADGFRERFEAEIESLKTLRHAGIVRLLGYGEDEGVLYYAMELVDGYSLDQELKAGRRFTWREVAQIGAQVCRALKHAHDHGIVHRDIKPANILQDKQERVKLADFGIARLFSNSPLTTAGGILGTADYMSPEQAAGQPVSDRTDQYSLGCVLYTLLAGRQPFKANSLPEMLQLQRFAEPEPISRYAPTAPRQLESAIAQMMRKNAADRFPNTLVLAKHLEAMDRALSRPAQDDFQVRSEPLSKSTLALPDSLAGSVTRASGADTPGYSQAPISLSEPAEAAERRTHFTAVGEEGWRDPDEEPWSWPAVVIKSLLALVLLAAVWLAGQWALRPPSADSLFASIEGAVVSRGDDGLSDSANRIDRFLVLYPTDPRADAVRELADQLELNRLEKRLSVEFRLGSGGGGESPERALYFEAMQLAQTDPDLAITRLDLLRDMLSGGPPEGAEPSAADLRAKFRVLAQRQQERLRTEVSEFRAAQRRLIVERLGVAQQVAAERPVVARNIAVGVIGLYQQQPWAADLVDEAKTIVDRLPDPEQPDPDQTGPDQTGPAQASKAEASAQPPQPADPAAETDPPQASKP
ncbi:Serine/threonine-protein kinase PrkC [Pirellulimonas nuda]|uniref:non-specific serine/threonine protein kinase n=1 Tax=Pirellulimonas nuda TaxID=2528009 RepID=A0A518DEH2_9BACT|nr:serine/threonine-protein kinase [Pirellulimonas nuda]QDU89870.1 Serine/threonine-protein kinase PrkC [Pirellulimonas nuda]